MEQYLEKKLWSIWNYNPNEIINETKKIIEKSDRNNNELSNIDLNNLSSLKKFMSILIDDITEYTTFHSMCSFLQFVSANKEVRRRSTEADYILTNYISSLNLRKDIYDQVKKFTELVKKNLNPDEEDLKFLNKIISSYKKNGVHLDNDSKNLLTKIKNEIIKIENLIVNSISENESKLLGFTCIELNGLPDDFIQELPIVDNNPIRYGITLTNNIYQECMRYVKDEDVRKKLEYYYHTKCSDCLDDIIRLFILRQKHAKLVGYDNHSDYINCEQMVKSSGNIKKFLTDLDEKLDYRYYREVDTLLKVKKYDYKKGLLKNFDGILNSWDIQYYQTQWKKAYGLDEQKVKQYFPMNFVLKSILDIYKEILGLNFVKNNGAPTWHTDVSMYTVFDGDKKLGYFYLDLYLRDGKVKQTRCFNLQPGCKYPYRSNDYQYPISALISSFVHPTKAKIILLSHNEVRALFHEFGHVIHQICGTTKYSIFSGTNVENDFIETPAQVLENLCWNKNVLKRLSSHYINKQPLSDDIIEKMIKIRNLNIGIHFKKHIVISMYDQFVHSSETFIKLGEDLLKIKEKDERNKNIMSTMNNLYEGLYKQIMCYQSKQGPYSIILNKDIFMPVSWINLIGGLDAKYYSYVWSTIYSSEIYFNKFLFNQSLDNAGNEFKKDILNYGGSKNANNMLVNYLNKEPSLDGFLKLYKLENDTEFSFYINTDINTSKINISDNEEDIDSDDIDISEDYSNRFSEYVESSEFKNDDNIFIKN